MPANSIFDGPLTNLLSILCILIEVLSCAHAKGNKKGLNDFKFGTFVRHFQSDGVASRAVKGLRGLLTSYTYGPGIVKLKLPMTDNQNRQATDHLSIGRFRRGC